MTRKQLLVAKSRAAWREFQRAASVHRSSTSAGEGAWIQCDSTPEAEALERSANLVGGSRWPAGLSFRARRCQSEQEHLREGALDSAVPRHTHVSDRYPPDIEVTAGVAMRHVIAHLAKRVNAVSILKQSRDRLQLGWHKPAQFFEVRRWCRVEGLDEHVEISHRCTFEPTARRRHELRYTTDNRLLVHQRTHQLCVHEDVPDVYIATRQSQRRSVLADVPSDQGHPELGS